MKDFNLEHYAAQVRIRTGTPWSPEVQCQLCHSPALYPQTSHSIQSLGPPSYKVIGGLPSGSEGKEPACNAGDLGSIPGSGRSPGEGNSNPLQYFCLEKIYGQRSLADNSPWVCKESDMTEQPTCSLSYLRWNGLTGPSRLWVQFLWIGISLKCYEPQFYYSNLD